jgi:hypothetical protein
VWVILRPPTTVALIRAPLTHGSGPASVRLADRVVTVKELRARPDQFTGLFARARAEVGHTLCQCRAD